MYYSMYLYVLWIFFVNSSMYTILVGRIFSGCFSFLLLITQNICFVFQARWQIDLQSITSTWCIIKLCLLYTTTFVIASLL